MAKATIAEIRKAIFKELLKNGDMSSNRSSGDGDIRRALIEADLVECMVTLPGQLFYSTQTPVYFGVGGKNNTLDSATDARLFDGETELSSIARRHETRSHHEW